MKLLMLVARAEGKWQVLEWRHEFVGVDGKADFEG